MTAVDYDVWMIFRLYMSIFDMYMPQNYQLIINLPSWLIFTVQYLCDYTNRVSPRLYCEIQTNSLTL